MRYPSDASYTCLYCKRKFEFAAGCNASQLIMHLINNHPTKAEANRDLYLSDIVKKCFEYKGGTHD